MRKIIWILCAVLLLSACSSNGNYPDLPESTDITEVTAATDATDATDTTDAIDLSDLPDVMVDVIFYDTPYVGSLGYRSFWRVSEEDQMDHPALQREVKKIPISYPITTLEQVEQYVNALYKISASLELLDSKLLDPDLLDPYLLDSGLIITDMISGSAFVYSDGVIWIGFGPALKPGVIHLDGVSAHVLVSAEDGHVILFDPD